MIVATAAVSSACAYALSMRSCSNGGRHDESRRERSVLRHSDTRSRRGIDEAQQRSAQRDGAASLRPASARRRISKRRSLAEASSAGTDPSDSTRAISASRRSRSARKAAIRLDGSGSVSRASNARRLETLASRDDVTVATGRLIASRKAMASAAVGDGSMLVPGCGCAADEDSVSNPVGDVLLGSAQQGDAFVP